MYMAKAIAAFVSLVITSIVASDVVPLTGTVHLVIAIVAIIAGAVSTYAIPNRPSVVQRIVP